MSKYLSKQISKHLSDETLSAYLDGDLKTSLQGRVQAHLDTCKECSAKLQQLSHIKTLAENLEMPEPPQWMLAGIKERIEQDKVKQYGYHGGFWKGILIGASASTFLALFFMLPTFLKSPNQMVADSNNSAIIAIQTEPLGPPAGLATAKSLSSSLKKNSHSAPALLEVPDTHNAASSTYHLASHEKPSNAQKAEYVLVPLDDEAKREYYQVSDNNRYPFLENGLTLYPKYHDNNNSNNKPVNTAVVSAEIYK